MKRRLIAVVSFAVLGGCAGMGGNKASRSLAEAQSTAATPATVSFAQADLNRDARISRHEFDLWLRQSAAPASAQAAAGGTRAPGDAFSAADTDLNGVLTLDEWQAMIGNPSAPAWGGPPGHGAPPRPPSAASRP